LKTLPTPALEAIRALETIRKVGITELCAPDGCCCLSFSVHCVHVDISCRKSSDGPSIRVYSHVIDSTDEHSLVPVMDEVKRQVAETFGVNIANFQCSFHEWKPALSGGNVK
jgi:hypothetical protein